MNQLPMGLRFSIIHRYMRKRMDERLRERDLTGVQLGVLAELEKLECSGAREINQKVLEDAARVTHPTMTEIIKRLEKKGFIRCEVSATDKRSKSIASTDKAKSLRKEMRDGGEAVFCELSAGLSPQQIASLVEITDIMLENVCKKECDKQE